MYKIILFLFSISLSTFASASLVHQPISNTNGTATSTLKMLGPGLIPFFSIGTNNQTSTTFSYTQNQGYVFVSNDSLHNLPEGQSVTLVIRGEEVRTLSNGDHNVSSWHGSIISFEDNHKVVRAEVNIDSSLTRIADEKNIIVDIWIQGKNGEYVRLSNSYDVGSDFSTPMKAFLSNASQSRQ